jgi:hypothetical protein
MKPACIYIYYIICVVFQLLKNFVKGFYLIFVIFYDNFIFCEPIKMAVPRPFNLNPSGDSSVLFPSCKAGFISFKLIALNSRLK